jgi:hypothetical protein
LHQLIKYDVADRAGKGRRCDYSYLTVDVHDLELVRDLTINYVQTLSESYDTLKHTVDHVAGYLMHRFRTKNIDEADDEPCMTSED